MSIDYMLGPCSPETPHEYLHRRIDQAFDVDLTTRCLDANYGTSPGMVAAMRAHADWIRYEQALQNRCSGFGEGLWELVVDLLIAGKHDHSTRPTIEEAIRLETAVSGRPLDEVETIDLVTFLKGF